MAAPELTHAERRMQQKWCDLVAAEQQGVPLQVLERMFNAYMLAVEEYNRCVAASTPAHTGVPTHTRRGVPSLPPEQEQNQTSPPVPGRRRKAS